MNFFIDNIYLHKKMLNDLQKAKAILANIVFQLKETLLAKKSSYILWGHWYISCRPGMMLYNKKQKDV